MTEHQHDGTPAHERSRGGHDKEAWEERYRSHSRVWSGQPNPVLVAEVAELTPGTALDAGSGEGADAIWLARRGWRVTGVDLSSTALDRARAHADELGLDVSWQQQDLAESPVADRYDLVAAHFLHLPAGPRRALFRHLSTAVAPGGTLLVVGHDPSDLETTVSRPPLAELGWTADEVAGSLGDGWTVVVAEARPRTAVDSNGREVIVRDAVLRARRDDSPRIG